MVIAICIAVAILLYLLFISKSQRVGARIYHAAMNFERKQAKLEIRSTDVNGTKMYFYQNEFVEGRQTLLLLHGFSADKTIWHRFAKYATNDYNLVIPDMLGHGDTPYSSSESYSTFTQTKALITLVQQLNVQRYSVIGNSMGGMIAMLLLLQDKQRINKAVLLDPAGAKSEYAMSMSEAQANPFMHKTFEHFLSFYMRSMAKAPFVPPSVLRYVGEQHYLGRYDELKHMFHDFFNVDEFFSDQQSVDPSKLLIIWGDKDGLLPVSDAKMWQEMTQAKLSIYEEIGHMPMVECPKRTYLECKEFCR
ncbi:alpha/beta hydrolase [Glaciecola sp. XM2]|uniref:alpha/beta fold hydrolase n=1 Tax=Glaciecola sp. XM2 TaxID=1914931 RepID=UPI001BDEED2B|nr:alpha/beta hydrolase [Glaciecola sp. XM2]MBT1449649.1 alpha/beta hydrolase [Glaciecola sp. XM2]